MGFSSLLTSSWDDVQKLFGINGNTTANFGPSMTENQKTALADSTTMQNAGLMMTVFGGLNSAIGGYYAAKSAQYQARSQALTLGFEADIAAINARSAETAAQSTLEAGKSQIFNTTMQAGQRKASSTASMAARGIALGAGTSREVTASHDIVKDIDMFTIDANATRQAAQQRTQATNYSNQALMDRAGAVNANRSAESISPFASFTSSLLTSASAVGQNWNNRQRMKMMYGSGYTPGIGGLN